MEVLWTWEHIWVFWFWLVYTGQDMKWPPVGGDEPDRGAHHEVWQFFHVLCLKRKIAQVGSIRRNKPELPPELLQLRQWQILSSVFAFTRTAMAVSYLPSTGNQWSAMGRRGSLSLCWITTVKKAAWIISTTYLPLLFFFCLCIANYLIVRITIMQYYLFFLSYASCRQIYSITRRKTNPWPHVLFYNLLDVSAYIAFVLWRSGHPDWVQEGLPNEVLFAWAGAHASDSSNQKGGSNSHLR